MSEDLIRKVLEEYLIEYKESHTIIIIVVLIIIALISTIQYIWTIRKIEGFKSELKKSQIKFSFYNELQIKSLSKIFTTLTDFKRITANISQSKNDNPEHYKKIASLWLKSFIETTEIFSYEKYILPVDLKNKYSYLISNFYTLNELIGKEKQLKSLYYTNESGDVELGGDNEDLNNIHKQLKEFNKQGVFSLAISSIDNLRSQIEKYFESIE